MAGFGLGEGDDDITYQSGRLETSGGNSSMDVNGSNTSQDFFFEPASGEVFYLEAISVIIQDGGSQDVNDFGSLGDLTNGVQIIHTRDGVERVIANLQANKDIAHCFNATLVPNNSGFLDDVNLFAGKMVFGQTGLILNGDSNDRITFRVRDNITGLTEFTACYHAWKGI